MSGISETQLREMLGRGLVALQYVKKDGSTRNAVGTLNRWFIPRDKRPLGPEKRRVTPWVKDDYVRFYDLSVQNWRCLVCSEVIEAKPIVFSEDMDLNDAMIEATLTNQEHA